MADETEAGGNGQVVRYNTGIVVRAVPVIKDFS
jgi:hypothetical protein